MDRNIKFCLIKITQAEPLPQMRRLHDATLSLMQAVDKLAEGKADQSSLVVRLSQIASALVDVSDLMCDNCDLMCDD
jgi:hypothetical protein